MRRTRLQPFLTAQAATLARAVDLPNLPSPQPPPTVMIRAPESALLPAQERRYVEIGSEIEIRTEVLQMDACF
jgi:hypothetical protein